EQHNQSKRPDQPILQRPQFFDIVMNDFLTDFELVIATVEGDNKHFILQSKLTVLTFEVEHTSLNCIDLAPVIGTSVDTLAIVWVKVITRVHHIRQTDTHIVTAA